MPSISERKLSWDTLSTPSKFMVPAYVGLFFILGIDYLFDDSKLGPGLYYADRAPFRLEGWGVMFFTAFLFMGVAILRQRRTLFRYALWWGIICLSVWSVVFIFAAAFNNASWGNWAPWAVLAVACKATDSSLLKGDR